MHGCKNYVKQAKRVVSNVSKESEEAPFFILDTAPPRRKTRSCASSKKESAALSFTQDKGEVRVDFHAKRISIFWGFFYARL
ncbi:hypothetical protein [Acinetobacter indicus]|uniref:hypothetical protein n=1 Tax=Acinetobacter indicus TaxID=756892 RepID=UPI0014449570|nr:hypothetical protein [Acinetobacter indicus]